MRYAAEAALVKRAPGVPAEVHRVLHPQPLVAANIEVERVVPALRIARVLYDPIDWPSEVLRHVWVAEATSLEAPALLPALVRLFLEATAGFFVAASIASDCSS